MKMNEFIENIKKSTHEAVDRLYDIFDDIVCNIIVKDIKPTKFEYDVKTGHYRFDIADLIGTINVDTRLFDIDIKVYADEKTVCAECVLDIEGRFSEQYSRFPSKESKIAVHDFFMKISDIKFTTEDPQKTEEPAVVDAEVAEDHNNE
jgi:hypothetical protein